MTIDLETATAIVVPAGAVIVWLVRLEGRINLSDARWTDIKDQLERISEKMDGFDEIKHDLSRIRKFIGNGIG